MTVVAKLFLIGLVLRDNYKCPRLIVCTRPREVYITLIC